MSTLIEVRGDLDWSGFLKLQRILFAIIEKNSTSEVELDCQFMHRVFPNGAVPLIILLDQYRSLHGLSIRVVNADNHPAMLKHDYLAHLDPNANIPPRMGATAVHCFKDDHELNNLIDQTIDQVLEQAKFAPGVLTAFEWFLNEIAGNVLVHAEGAKGWLQVQIHPTTNHLAVVVADGGIGIPASIRSSGVLQRKFGSGVIDDGDAIEIAIREGVTSKPDFGQGKGLTGTMSIVKANPSGRLMITSQKGQVLYAPDSIGLKVQSHFPPFSGTMIDVQLDFSQPLAIEEALWGRAPTNFTETVYGKDTPIGIMKLRLKDQAPSFGNRITAKRIRLKIENLLTESPSDAIELDFESVSILASSFADEVFGKLARNLGIIGFSRRLRFVNLNTFCQGIIDDVVQARMAQTYANKNDTLSNE